MSKTFTFLIISLALIFSTLFPQDSSKAAGNKTSVGTSLENQLRVRSGPGTDFRILGFLKKGQVVSVLDTNENWVKISSSFGDGWVAKDFLKISAATKVVEKQNSNKTNSGVVTGDILNVRKDPLPTGTVIGKLAKGTNVTIYSQQNGWYQIQFSKQKGWVSAEFTKTGSIQATEQPTKVENGITGTVTASSLSIRNGASLNAKIVGTVTKGQKFSILEETNNWVKIEYKPGSAGWASSFYIEKNEQTQTAHPGKETSITILQDGSNIRTQPTVQADVLQRANAGDIFEVTKIINDWYEIMLKDGSLGYIAGWIVSSSDTSLPIEKPGTENYLKNKTIVLDPGHGGVDNGTTGASGTLEKELTIKTAKLLYDKLRASGANVFLTRTNDSYISLPSRVSYSQTLRADAFISLHYDSNLDRSVRGMTSYYYHPYQKLLAEMVCSSIANETRMDNRGVRFGDFHVIRENSQKAVLIELGYLSNPNEEITLNSSQFQESVTSGIYNGLVRFFKEK